MTDKDNGGPAFPAPEAARWHFADPSAYLGMTLRDYFAAKASEEDIARMMKLVPEVKFVRTTGGISRVCTELPTHARQIARYIHADAMLKARES